MLNKDYRDILSIFSEKKVKYLLVGAYAMAAHGFPRSTMDIDLFIKPDPDNAVVVVNALDEFGAPIGKLSADDLQKKDLIFQIGVAPRRIDILTSIDGIDFDEGFSRSVLINIEGIDVPVLSVPDIIFNKRTTGRMKDLADAETLEEDSI